ncbi:MAG: hypothetical protein ACE5ES_05330 [Candidatus Nanoarchaeia archaeon]
MGEPISAYMKRTIRKSWIRIPESKRKMLKEGDIIISKEVFQRASTYLKQRCYLQDEQIMPTNTYLHPSGVIVEIGDKNYSGHTGYFDRIEFYSTDDDKITDLATLAGLSLEEKS